MVVELGGFFPDSLDQDFQVRPVVQLYKQLHEEARITSRVDEVPSRPFVLRLPYLHDHRLGEYLLSQLVLSTHRRGHLGRCFVIDYMCGLEPDQQL